MKTEGVCHPSLMAPLFTRTHADKKSAATEDGGEAWLRLFCILAR